MKRIAQAWLVIAAIALGFSSAAPEPRVLELRASFSWAGLALSWPGYDYVVRCEQIGVCRAAGSRWERAGSKQKTTCSFAAFLVKADALQALWRASTRHLVAVKQPLEVI